MLSEISSEILSHKRGHKPWPQDFPARKLDYPLGITRLTLSMGSTRELVERWMREDKNEVTREEIRKLKEANDEDELRARLGSRMAFGTAGLRAAMGAGYSRMNQLTIIQTTQGLCEFILKEFKDAKQRGVAIGRDARHNSEIFAALTASIFLHKGFKVYHFSEICPTPFVPYAVRKYGCVAGVMVTASHNPKTDNGYKVYWSNGAQIIPPIDKGIAKNIEDNLEVWPESWSTEIMKTSPDLCLDPYDDVYKSYYSDLTQCAQHREDNPNTPVKFTYTPLHGVGQEFATAAFKAFDFPPFLSIPEQMQPDPDFPTVTFPNPEEGKSALVLAMKMADAHGSSIVLANDPDCDRLAIAEKVNGTWRIFNGNEIGALLAKWALDGYKNKLDKEGALFQGDTVWMLNSTVSSRLLQSMAKIEGFQHEETLTGFKWMGNRSCEKLAMGHTVLFAFEEAIGFMYGTMVLDKDGISGLAVAAEYATTLYKKGTNFTGEIEMIYRKYGVHHSDNSYYICTEKERIKTIFQSMRDVKYGPRCITLPGDHEVKVTNVRDLTVGYDESTPDKQPKLPTDRASQLITWTFDNNCAFTLRTSGTEPKIKYYCEMWSEPGESNLMPPMDVSAMAKICVDSYLKPEEYKLQARKH
ncbi:phosphopentomutase-like [Dysidea avara]|uniref:phosphopentomutase-like n=1 Tax=Dysidea avara TaxID=196820 RepID=UPI003319DD79